MCWLQSFFSAPFAKLPASATSRNVNGKPEQEWCDGADCRGSACGKAARNAPSCGQENLLLRAEFRGRRVPCGARRNPRGTGTHHGDSVHCVLGFFEETEFKEIHNPFVFQHRCCLGVYVF